MKKIASSFQSESFVIKISILLLVFTAIFSLGFHHADEHFQILEFAGSKLGLTEIENLTWEYEAKIRPTLQPTIAIGVHRILGLFGIENTYTTAFFLRLLSGAMSFLSMFFLYSVLREKITIPKLKKWFLWLSFIMWFALYNGVRFSSENWSGTIFIIGFSLYFLNSNKKLINYLLIGLLFGTSFVFRFQSGFLIAGYMAWLLFIDKEKIKNLVVLFLGILVVTGAGILIDSWFYGEWTVSMWNYFEVNLIQDKAASFGTHPWYYYITKFFQNAIPPFSLVFIIAVFSFFTFKPKSPITWSILPFLLVHFIIGHKELRFLFPIVGFLPFMVVYVIQKYESKRSFINTKAFQVFIFLFFLVNFGLSLVVSLRSAAPKFTAIKSIYDYSETNTTLYFTDRNPFESKLKIHFYRRPELKIEKIEKIEDIPTNNNKKLVVFNRNKPDDLPEKYQLIYSPYPDWVKHFNVNGWVERVGGWYIYEVK